MKYFYLWKIRSSGEVLCSTRTYDNLLETVREARKQLNVPNVMRVSVHCVQPSGFIAMEGSEELPTQPTPIRNGCFNNYF